MNKLNSKEKEINEQIKTLKYPGKISDGYHTFDELYEHRHLLYINFCNLVKDLPGFNIFTTLGHKDKNDVWDGWFLLCIDYETEFDYKQISYHLPIEFMYLCSHFNKKEFNDTYDNHNSKDILIRLEELLKRLN